MRTFVKKVFIFSHKIKSFYQNNKVFKKGPYVYGKDEDLFDKCPHLFQIIPTASFSHIQ